MLERRGFPAHLFFGHLTDLYVLKHQPVTCGERTAKIVVLGLEIRSVRIERDA